MPITSSLRRPGPTLHRQSLPARRHSTPSSHPTPIGPLQSTPERPDALPSPRAQHTRALVSTQSCTSSLPTFFLRHDSHPADPQPRQAPPYWPPPLLHRASPPLPPASPVTAFRHIVSLPSSLRRRRPPAAPRVRSVRTWQLCAAPSTDMVGSTIISSPALAIGHHQFPLDADPFHGGRSIT